MVLVRAVPAKKTHPVPTRLTVEQINKMDYAIKQLGLRSRSEFVREAVEYYLKEIGSIRVIRIRDVEKDQAKNEILEYLKEKEEADTFDIANDLRLDLDLTMKVLKELWEEGMVE